jgi:transposase
MVAQEMVDRGVALRQVARQLGVTEGALRYRLRRPVAAADGRRERPTALDGWDPVVTAVLERFGDARVTAAGDACCEARQVFDVLVREYGFGGSYQAVRRYLRRRFGPPPVQAVRRVELPPGVQAQHDWFEEPLVVAGERVTGYGLLGTLSFSRATFVWVSATMTQLAWQSGHLALLRRYGGVPLWVRIDNLKTGVARGAGPTAVVNATFQRFAAACGFQVDPCRPAMGQDKGKVERQVRTERSAFADLFRRAWPSWAALQAALDARAAELHARRPCPATGTSVAAAFAAEQPALRPLPALSEPFDVVVARRVSRDCLVSFEGRRYSVPFRWVGHSVEVLGTAQHVVIQADGREVARHPRHTARRLVLEPTHYDGPSTATVLAPPPIGRRGRLQLAHWEGLPDPAAVARPLTAYLALVEEVAR